MSTDLLKYDAQFIDNETDDSVEEIIDEYKKKRIMLEKTKIVKQTWYIKPGLSKK